MLNSKEQENEQIKNIKWKYSYVMAEQALYSNNLKSHVCLRISQR